MTATASKAPSDQTSAVAKATSDSFHVTTIAAQPPNDSYHVTAAAAKKAPSEPNATSSHRGELRLGLMFSPSPSKQGHTKGTLHIAVKNARNLPNMDTKGLTDGFVKLYLLPDKSAKGKKKTAVIKDNLSPEWNEEFAYERVLLEDLRAARVLEVTVWDYDRGSSNDFVGGLRLGSAPNRTENHKEWMDSNADEASHWEEMLTRHDEWVECWHSLRASMDPRTIDLSDIPALALERDENREEKHPPQQSGGGVKERSGESEGISLSVSADVVNSEWDQEFRKVTVNVQQQQLQQQALKQQEEDSKAFTEVGIPFTKVAFQGGSDT